MSDLKPPNIPALPSSVDTSVRRAFDALRGWFSSVATRGGVIDRSMFSDLLQESDLNTPFSDGAIPPKPQNVVVSGAFRTIIIEWDDPRYKNLAHAELWRSPDSSLSNAQLVGTTNASLYSDTPPNASLSVTYTYWVRFVSIAGIYGPFSDSASGSTADDPAYVLELLVGEITESELDQGLSQRITQIETNAATAIANIGTITTSDFTDASTYNVGALVKYQGEIYKCITDINSTPAPLPTNATYWIKVGQYASLADMVSATASGLTSLDTRTDAAEGTITAHSSQITALESTVNDPATGVDATASGLTVLDTRVTSAEGTITTNSTAITNLSGRMTTAEGGITSQGSAINLLDVRLTSAEGTISSQSSDVTLLDSRLTTAEGTVSGHSTAISSLETRATNTEGTVTAQASQISGLTSRMGSAESAIVSEAQTRASADSALTSNVNQLFASVGANTAAIQTEQLVRATTTGPNWASGTTYAAGKVVIYGGALYQCISSHYSSSGNAPPNGTYWKSVTASLYSQYTVKTDVNGYVAGFGLANDGVTSSFRVRADVFSIGSPGYPDRTPFVVDTVNGRVVMDSALIKDGTITNAKIATAAIDSAKISNAAIVEAKIADLAVTNAKIANAAITSAKIQDAAITNAKIGSAEIGTLKIAGEAVTVPRLLEEYYYNIPNTYTTIFDRTIYLDVPCNLGIQGTLYLSGTSNNSSSSNFEVWMDGMLMESYLEPGWTGAGALGFKIIVNQNWSWQTARNIVVKAKASAASIVSTTVKLVAVAYKR